LQLAKLIQITFPRGLIGTTCFAHHRHCDRANRYFGYSAILAGSVTNMI
jgi:hypothetical protein